MRRENAIVFGHQAASLIPRLACFPGWLASLPSSQWMYKHWPNVQWLICLAAGRNATYYAWQFHVSSSSAKSTVTASESLMVCKPQEALKYVIVRDGAWSFTVTPKLFFAQSKFTTVRQRRDKRGLLLLFLEMLRGQNLRYG